MTTDSDNLVSLEELRSVLNAYAGPAYPRERAARRRRRGWRPLLVVAVAVTAFVATGVAIAAGLGAFNGGVFNGIGAAHHRRDAEDVISPAARAYIERTNCTLPSGKKCSPMLVGARLDTSRRIAQLPGGQGLYVFKTTWRGLCFVAGQPHAEFNCSSPLSRSHPSTAWIYSNSPDRSDWLTFGIAVDGVTAVSFDANGRDVTVPVKHNVWTYQSGSLQTLSAPFMHPLAAHFADGTTVVDRCVDCLSKQILRRLSRGVHAPGPPKPNPAQRRPPLTPKALFKANPQGSFGAGAGPKNLWDQTAILSSVKKVASVDIPKVGPVAFWHADAKQGGWCGALRLRNGDWLGTDEAHFLYLGPGGRSIGLGGGAAPGCFATEKQRHDAKEGRAPTGFDCVDAEIDARSVHELWEVRFGLVNVPGAVKVRDLNSGASTDVVDGKFFLLPVRHPPRHLLRLHLVAYDKSGKVVADGGSVAFGC